LFRRIRIAGHGWTAIAIVCLLFGASLGLYLSIGNHRAPVGVLIGIMGFVAAAITFRDKPQKMEKATWIVLMTVLLVAEIRNLYVADAEQNAKQEKINEGLTTTAAGINTAVKNITGGDSYCYLAPAPVVGAKDVEQLLVGNSGDVALPTCTIRLVELPSPSDTGEQALQKFNQPPISLQNVAPRQQGAHYIQNSIHAGPDRKYEAVITTPTHSFVEIISFKLDSAGTYSPICELRSSGEKLLKSGCDTLPPN
jgi:hypothetical protein